MYFAARKHGALGLATECIEAESFCNFLAARPDLEVLACFKTHHEAQQYFVSDMVFTKVTNYGTIR